MLSIKEAKSKLLAHIRKDGVVCKSIRVKSGGLLDSPRLKLFVCQYPGGNLKSFVVNRENGSITVMRRIEQNA